MEAISLLHEVLSYYLEGWKENQQATESQREMWPQNRKIPQKQLGKDAEGCLRLLKKDGYDGEPVADVSSGTTPHFFQDNSNHCFPSDQTLFRFGVFFHLNLYEITLLVVKGQWEKYFSKKLDWQKNFEGKTLLTLLKFSVDEALEYSLEFNLGTEEDTISGAELYQMFEEYGAIASKAGYNQENYITLVHQMIMSNIHLYALNDKNAKQFIEKQKRESKILKNKSEMESEEYWIAKCSWIELENEIGKLLLELENQRLENHNINHKWLTIFGEDYVKLRERKQEYYSLKHKIDIKKEDPELSLDEIIKLEKKINEEKEKELEELRLEVAFASNYTSPTPVYVNADEISEYEKNYEKLIKKIWKYTHPDIFNRENFSENQKGKLRDYFSKTMKIKKEETGFNMRSLLTLTEILSQVKKLWDNMGYDVESIQGESYEEQLNWLEKEIERLEQHKKEIKNEMYSLLNDKDIIEKRSTMLNEDIINRCREELKNKKEYYDRKIEDLKKEYEGLFRCKPTNIS